jgi:hypothetical protein
VDPRAALDNVKKRKLLTLPGLELRPLGRPARSQSLYRLCHLLEDTGADDKNESTDCQDWKNCKRTKASCEVDKLTNVLCSVNSLVTCGVVK